MRPNMGCVLTETKEISKEDIIDPNAGEFIVASASPGTVLIYQKNKEIGRVRKGRSRFKIIEDMLMVLTEEESVEKTRVMQRVCLNWRDLQKYFDFLMKENLIAECNNPRSGTYVVTEKGRELLKRLKDVKEILG